MDCIKCGKELQGSFTFCPFCGKKQAVTPKKKAARSRPNGSGTVYKRGKTWVASYTHGYTVEDGKRKAVRSYKYGFPTKKEALEYLPTLAATPVRKVPKLIDLWESFKNGKKFEKLSASQKGKYETAWKKIEPLWFCKIDQLTTFDLQNAVDTKAETYYPARDIRDLFSKLYQAAMPDQFVSANLADYIELPDLHAKEGQPFQKDEIQKLWVDYGAGNWWTGYLLLMIYTGMMPGELLDARKDCIDWEGKQITGAGKKTDKRKETPIVLADFIIPVLADLCNHTQGEKLIRINKDRFYTVYYETLERAGCRRLPPYSCRHTAATAMALESIPPSVIQKIMRHARFSTTEKYIHVDLEPMRQAINQLQGKQKQPQPETAIETATGIESHQIIPKNAQ